MCLFADPRSSRRSLDIRNQQVEDIRKTDLGMTTIGARRKTR